MKLIQRRALAKFGLIFLAAPLPLAILAGCRGRRGGVAPPPPTPKRIAFVSFRDGNPEIYVMNANGSNQTNITNNPAEDLWPSWSPK